MISKAANLLSIIFHPLLMTSILFAILYSVGSPVTLPVAPAIKQFLLIIFLITFLIPLLSISFLRLTKTISSVYLVDRKERVIPFIFITVFYFTISFMFIYKQNITSGINLVFLTISILILLVTAITFFFKISAHAAALGGIVGFIMAYYLKSPELVSMEWVLGSILILGLIMSARLYLNAHKPSEVYFGSLLGFITCFISIIFYS